MMPEEVRKAQERIVSGIYAAHEAAYRDVETIRAHLLAGEAEVERHVKMLADCFRMAGADPDGNEDWRIAPNALRAVTDLRHDYDAVLDWQTRCERAEALLRECAALMEYHRIDHRHMGEKLPLGEKITAHLSENSRG